MRGRRRSTLAPELQGGSPRRWPPHRRAIDGSNRSSMANQAIRPKVANHRGGGRNRCNTTPDAARTNATYPQRTSHSRSPTSLGLPFRGTHIACDCLALAASRSAYLWSVDPARGCCGCGWGGPGRRPGVAGAGVRARRGDGIAGMSRCGSLGSCLPVHVGRWDGHEVRTASGPRW
jgi:hypothetical protein